jgi:hypothetical protein
MLPLLSAVRYVTVYDIVWGVTSKLIKIAHTYCGWCCKYYTQTVIRHCHLINTIHQQIVHLAFDIRSRYKHESTINIHETCPWSRWEEGGWGCGSHVLVKFGTGCGSSLEKTPQVIRINHEPIYILNCYYMVDPDDPTLIDRFPDYTTETDLGERPPTPTQRREKNSMRKSSNKKKTMSAIPQ